MTNNTKHTIYLTPEGEAEFQKAYAAFCSKHGKISEADFFRIVIKKGVKG